MRGFLRGLGRCDQRLPDPLGRIGVLHQLGIHTVSRVLCWQAKMRTPPGASAVGHMKVRNFAAETVPFGNVTGRSKSVGPIGVKATCADLLGASSRIDRGEGDALDAFAALVEEGARRARCARSQRARRAAPYSPGRT